VLTARGGNLLINVGPMADGTIPDVQQRPLRDLGKAIAAGI
jgi:alpha-L-fucosidase